MQVRPEVEMRRYNDLMNTVPLESTSVPLILYCMLEQVSCFKPTMIPALVLGGRAGEALAHQNAEVTPKY